MSESPFTYYEKFSPEEEKIILERIDVDIRIASQVNIFTDQLTEKQRADLNAAEWEFFRKARILTIETNYGVMRIHHNPFTEQPSDRKMLRNSWEWKKRVAHVLKRGYVPYEKVETLQGEFFDFLAYHTMEEEYNQLKWKSKQQKGMRWNFAKEISAGIASPTDYYDVFKMRPENWILLAFSVSEWHNRNVWDKWDSIHIAWMVYLYRTGRIGEHLLP